MSLSRAEPETNHPTLIGMPAEVREMIYGFVLGDHTIHIKSDMIPQESHSVDDEDSEDSVYDEEEEEEVEWPADISEVLNSNRGPLYHSLCDNELLHPRDARLYRIRSLEAHGSRNSREQSDIMVQDFKLAKYKMESDLNLECELIGSDDEEDTPTRQVNLAFLRVCKLVHQEAVRVLYSTKTFGFDDATTFAKFFSIDCINVLETKGRNLLFTDRRAIRSVQLRAKTGLCLRQKLLWTSVLNAATLILPGLNKIRVTFDLCHIGNEHFVDGTPWQSGRHRRSFPLLKRAEVRVATHFTRFYRGDDAGEVSVEFRDVGWGTLIVEDDVRHHMDALFGTLPVGEYDDSDDDKGGEDRGEEEKGEVGAEGEIGEEGEEGEQGEQEDDDEQGEDNDEEDDDEEVEEAYGGGDDEEEEEEAEE